MATTSCQNFANYIRATTAIRTSSSSASALGSINCKNRKGTATVPASMSFSGKILIIWRVTGHGEKSCLWKLYVVYSPLLPVCEHNDTHRLVWAWGKRERERGVQSHIHWSGVPFQASVITLPAALWLPITTKFLCGERLSIHNCTHSLPHSLTHNSTCPR